MSEAIEQPLFAGWTLITRASEEDFFHARPGWLNKFMATKWLWWRPDLLPKVRGSTRSSLAIATSFWASMLPTAVQFFWSIQGGELSDWHIPGIEGPLSISLGGRFFVCRRNLEVIPKISSPS